MEKEVNEILLSLVPGFLNAINSNIDQFKEFCKSIFYSNPELGTSWYYRAIF